MSLSISVVIPVYDHAAELVACLRSLRAQTLLPHEVIVVDDGSSDDPEGAVRAAGLRDGIADWVRLSSNQGAPAARNRGFASASGEAVIFLDADAEVRPDGLARLAAALDQDPAAAFAYSAFRFGRKTFLGRAFAPEALAEGNFIHTSALIRRAAFPGFDPALAKFQDWDLWIRIAAAGGRGAYVPEVLLTIKERVRGGMSRWLPAFAYRLPWRFLGGEPEPVRRYREAKKVIETKHRAWFESMRARAVRPTIGMGGWILLVLACFSISATAIGTPANGILALALGLLMVPVAYRRPSLALALLAFELLIGSRGGWLKLGSDAVNDGGVGVRILLFAGFFVGWGASLLARRRLGDVAALAREGRLRPYALLALALAWGVARGLWLRQPFLVPDANAWGFLLLVIPAASVWSSEPKRLAVEVGGAIRAGLVWLTASTLALFVIFSRLFAGLPRLTDPVYAWIRRSGIGEITNAGHGVSRIFLISQLFLVFAWLWVLVRSQGARLPISWRSWLAWVALGAALVASFSRSFALGLGVAALAATLAGFFAEGARAGWDTLRRYVARPALALAGALAFVLAVASASSLSSVLGSRLSSDEAAAASRWSLLPVMREGIGRHPFLGSGFGATLTYRSSDPRIVAKTGGAYTAYAFEWGWLDLWYKLGIFGAAAVLTVLGSLVVRAGGLAGRDRVFVWTSVLALAAIHAFTPYVNHPLGLGLAIFLEGFVVLRARPSQQEDPQA